MNNYNKTRLAMIESILKHQHDTPVFNAWKHDLIQRLRTIHNQD